MSTQSAVRPQTAGAADEAPPTAPLALPVEVVHVGSITPNMVRITVAGNGIRNFADEGVDQWMRVLLPRPGQQKPVLPTTEQWWPEICAMPEPIQPIVRNYTVRHVRPRVGELDIDIVRHGDSGPATRWAGRARVGDQIGILDQSTTYAPPADAPWRLLIGDESALPAIASILEGLPADGRAIAIVEIPTPHDVQDLDTDADLTVHWLPRPPGVRVGTQLLAAMQDAALPRASPYVFLAGEQRLVRNARRHLIGARGYPRAAICFMSYWRLSA